MRIVITTEQEAETRWRATVSVPADLAAYGSSRDEAVVQAQALTLHVIAGQIRSGVPLPPEVNSMFEVKRCGHNGKVLTFRWRSRAHGYESPYWSCCGEFQYNPECSRTFGLHHPGVLIGAGSSRSGGHGAERWSCCGKWRRDAGCTAVQPAADASTDAEIGTSTMPASDAVTE